jgi:hypothetical protein
MIVVESLLQREALLLVFLSLADLLMTYVLLWRGEHFYESNPVAHWFFARWNVAGLAGFKFGMVGLVVVLSETIERHRPGVGRAILLLGSLVALAVTVHGMRLLLAHG